MKLLICALAAVLTIVSAGPTYAQKSDSDSGKKSSKLVTKYDKSKNRTAVRTKEFRITQLILEKQSTSNIPLHQVDMSASADFDGETPGAKVGDVILRFHVTSSNFVFLRPQNIIATLDNDDGNGRAIMIGEAEYKSGPPKFNSVYEEFLTVNITPEVLSKMTKAKSLEIYIGPVKYKVAPENLALLTEFSDYVGQSSTASK